MIRAAIHDFVREGIFF